MAALRLAGLPQAVDAILERTGDRVACATPLGLGKPVPLLNSLYARVCAEPRRHLSIFTALSLEIPRAASELERRFLDPFVERVFAGVPELDYMRDLRRSALPPNVQLFEFYLRPGALLSVPSAQQNYVSSNYTHAGRDMLSRGINAVLVMVSERGGRFSLSCNPDLTVEVAQGMRSRGAPCVVAALVNRKLPFMGADAEVDADFFDVIIDDPAHEHELFGIPCPPIEPAEHAIGLRAAALVRDGGTLQLGIGSLGDAVAHWLRQRHVANAEFAAAVAALGMDRSRQLIAQEGGLESFAAGLFGSSEMFTWGLMTLFRTGVLRRRADGADGGPMVQAGFFLGPTAFYRELRSLPEDERAAIQMTSVARINDLFGEEGAVRRQRRDARFLNICMMVTLSGAAVSDGLADGRVVSGVGGQYNFVAMAHELVGARSILLLRSTRETAGRIESNIVFNYGHVTIPRHLRDIVVTEYGIADLRGRTDAEIAAALIASADARFQDDLAARSKAAGKLPRTWQVPDHARANTPERLSAALAPLAARGLLPMFPLGTDFDADEQRLVPALQWLKRNSSSWRGRLSLAAALAGSAPSADEERALARMRLDGPRTLSERLLRRLVALALEKTR